jgi:RHS repeat-associated protein
MKLTSHYSRRGVLTTNLLAVVTLLVAASAANGMYDPKHGRWLQRDPLGVRPDPPRGEIAPLAQYAGAHRDGLRQADWVGDVHYSYRYHTPRSSSDPITEDRELNIYLFCQNNAVNRIDANGLADVRITPTQTRNLNNQECGAYDVAWDFTVNWYDCYSYDYMIIVQKVDVWVKCNSCETTPCRDTKGKNPKKPSPKGRANLSYYEAWEFDVPTGVAGNTITAQDEAKWTSRPNSCGSTIQRSETRAYCANKGDRIHHTVQQWKQKIGTPVGSVDCLGDRMPWSAGQLPWNEKAPTWWKGSGDGGSSGREASSSWNCCCGDKDKLGRKNTSQAWASP